LVEPCTGRFDPRGLWEPAFVGRMREAVLLRVRVPVELAAGRERVVLGAGAGRARVEKFFVRVTEC